MLNLPWISTRTKRTDTKMLISDNPLALPCHAFATETLRQGYHIAYHKSKTKPVPIEVLVAVRDDAILGARVLFSNCDPAFLKPPTAECEGTTLTYGDYDAIREKQSPLDAFYYVFSVENDAVALESLIIR